MNWTMESAEAAQAARETAAQAKLVPLKRSAPMRAFQGFKRLWRSSIAALRSKRLKRAVGVETRGALEQLERRSAPKPEGI